MILSLEEVKEYLKIDYDDEDNLLTDLILTAESYLYNATGIKYDSSNQLAKLYCRVLVYEWYKDRGLTMSSSKTMNAIEKNRFTLQSILLQLKLGGDNGGKV
ncbi:head-tail connector protein [Clostridium baratii]|uniref:head-tail connector protein n=1 Tax=Clostridium baratii TaxID=1561 RepID=UPI003D7A8BA1